MAKRLKKLLSRRRLGTLALGVGIGTLGGGVVQWALSGSSGVEDHSSVRGFGAVGDGSHDDTDALQRAIDHGNDLLWFPAGRYRITKPLLLRSGQTWRGDGATQSVLLYGGSGLEPPFNMLFSPPDGRLEAFTLQDIGLWGGRSQQVTPSRSGQEGFAVYARGSVAGVTLRNCRFEHCGDGRAGGGGVVLGPRPEAVDAVLQNVVIEGCVFADNANVPGVYLCAPTTAPTDPLTRHGHLRIQGNVFGGAVGSQQIQNSVYLLGGGSQAPLCDVDISHNQFSYATGVDAAIELNWVDGFSITDNTLRYRAAIANSASILIRDGCQTGTIRGNILTVEGDTITLTGISLLNFAHPAQISKIIISENMLSGLTTAIALDRGTASVVVSNNQINSPSNAESVGVRVVDAQDISIQGNMIADAAHAVLVGYGSTEYSRVQAVMVTNNRFTRCGQGGAVIGALLPAVPRDGALGRLVVQDNQVMDSAAGVPLLDPLFLPLGASERGGAL